MFPPWAELRRGLGQHQAEPAQKSQARQLGTGLEAGRADNPSISAVLLKNKVSQSVVWGGEGVCAELETAWLGFHWPWVLVPLTSLAGPGRTPGGHLFRLRRDAGPQGPGSASPSEAAPPCLTGFACTSAPPPVPGPALLSAFTAGQAWTQAACRPLLLRRHGSLGATSPRWVLLFRSPWGREPQR